MTILRKWWTWMTSRPLDDGTLLTVIVWWEVRRISYNLFLAAIGIPGLLFFFVAIAVSGVVKPGEDAIEPMALMAAPFAANIAYTAGWIVEGAALMAQRPERLNGPRLMKAGLLFSVAVVVFPGLLWTLIDLVRLAMHLSSASG